MLIAGASEGTAPVKPVGTAVNGAIQTPASTRSRHNTSGPAVAKFGVLAEDDVKFAETDVAPLWPTTVK